MTEIVIATGVSKTYRVGTGSLEVLRGIDLRVHRGQFCALVGPSGSGKSTLLAILGALEPATAGEIDIDGVRVSSLSGGDAARFRSQRLGFVFQSYNLIASLTAAENVRLAMELKRGGLHGRAAARAADALLDGVGLLGRAGSRANLLSGGEQQRVAVARALANQPTLILADEPTGNLDSASGQLVMSALLRVRDAGGTLLVVTHDPGIAAQADQVVRLRDGLVEPVGAEWALR